MGLKTTKAQRIEAEMIQPDREFDEFESPKWRVEINSEMMSKVMRIELITGIIDNNQEQQNISAKVYLWDELIAIWKGEK